MEMAFGSLETREEEATAVATVFRLAGMMMVVEKVGGGGDG